MSEWRAKALELFPDMRPQIQSADSVGSLWIELMARFSRYYRQLGEGIETEDPPELIRATCLYAVWCTRSKTFSRVQEPALISFYEGLGREVCNRRGSIRKEIIDDLVENLGLPELEKHSGTIGYSVKDDELEKFLVDAREAENERRRRARGRAPRSS